MDKALNIYLIIYINLGPISSAANNFLKNNQTSSNSSVSASPTNTINGSTNNQNINGSINFSNFESVS